MQFIYAFLCKFAISYCSLLTPNDPMQAIAWSKTEPMPDNIVVQAHFIAWTDTPAHRAKIIEHLKSYPKGKRALFTHNAAIISRHPLDRCANSEFQCPWFDHGIEERLQWYRAFMDELKAADAIPDYFVFDIEDYSNNWQWCASHLDNSHFDAIEADPRSSEILAETGLRNLKGVCNFFTSKDYQIWNGWVWDHQEQYYRKLIDLLLSYNPKMGMSDWFRSRYGLSEPLDANCHIPAVRLTQGKLGKGWNFGSEGSFIMYGGMMRESCRDPEQGLISPMPRTPMASLVYDMNRVIAGKRAGTGKFAIWLPNRTHTVNGYQDDPKWYREWVFHAYLSGASRFLYWNPTPPYGSSDAAQMKELSDAMKEADKYLGYSNRKSLVIEMLGWNASSIKSCMMANRKTVCRITSDNGSGVWEVR